MNSKEKHFLKVVGAVILIVIVGICLVDYMKKHGTSQVVGQQSHRLPRVAIATMTKDPEDMGVWLRYHLDKLGFERIYLRVESTPGLRDTLAPYADRVSATFVEQQDNRNSYTVQIERQGEHVDGAIADCRERGIDILLHIDDDELFLVSDRHKTAPRFFSSLPDHNDHFHFQNAEAVFPGNSKHCFDTDTFIRCDKGSCLSYANGKGACRTASKNAKSFGPHFMQGDSSMEVPDTEASILHFDSCKYGVWKRKFANLSNIDQSTFENIPFQFYKDSISMLRDCQHCEHQHLQFWRRHKVAPYQQDVPHSFTLRAAPAESGEG